MTGSSRQNGKVSARVKTAMPSGTALAISNSNSSCPTLCKNRQKTGWGGARNFRNRVSSNITAHNAMTILGAWQFANAIGLPLNRSITVHFGRLGVPDSKAGPVLSAFLKTLGDRIRKAGGTFAAAWVRENGTDRGSHAHIFAHIPAKQLALVRRLQARWLRRAAGGPLKAGTLRGRNVRGAGAEWPSNALYLENGGNVIRYLVKGTSQNAAAFLGLTKTECAGEIIGKRSGTTENLGRAAWARAGWKQSLPNPH